MIRGIRHWLGDGTWPAHAPFDGIRHREAFDRAFWLVRIYYAATLFIAYQEMAPLRATAVNGGTIEPLWPVFWATDAETAGTILLCCLITTALLAVLFADRRWPKILVFLSFLSTSAYRTSFGLGSINHGNHYWLWIGFCFCFLPSGPQAHLRASLASRYRYLLTFWYAQALILLFYSMSGFWKIAGAIEAMIAGRINAFHPEALAMIVTWKMIQLDRPTMLGPTLAAYPWLGWPLHVWVIYIELVAFLVVFRPALHQAWGVMLACFHIGTFLLLGISFPKHILVLTILFIWSPFVVRRYGIREMAASLPWLGWLIKRRPNGPERSRPGFSGTW